MSDEIETIDKNPKSWAAWKMEAERLQAIIDDMALAAMDSEPDRNPVLAYADSYRDMAKQGVESVPIWSVITDLERNIAPLYRHAQPAPVVMDDTKLRELFDSWFASDCSFDLSPEASEADNIAWRESYWYVWQRCRAAMLQELKKSAGTEAICRSDENVQVLHTKSPAQSDCCPAPNVVVPAQSPIDHGYLPECECSGCKATARTCTEMAVNSLVIPNEMTSEQAYEIGYYYGDPVDVFARGANWMRQHIIDSTLAAAPQLPGSDPATVPGKWIPVSEQMPEDEEQYYLTYSEGDGVCRSYFFDGYFADQYITHWMPLPAAPQEIGDA
ncbi:Eaa1 [Klebsiella pneumoniae]|nr:Eaa1 [Klebsiella pneumoniae]